LCDSGWITHLRGQLELFSFGSFIERLAERFTLVRYDKPGCGLSDREGVDLSFDGQVAAALAVADAVGAGRRAVSWLPRSRRGTRTGWRRWCCTGCAPAAAIWRLPR
jgi:pimeloyl-ACP methyl ester carboxylesterase